MLGYNCKVTYITGDGRFETIRVKPRRDSKTCIWVHIPETPLGAGDFNWRKEYTK